MTTFLVVMVALPIAALVFKATSEGGQSFWDAISSPEAVSALKITLATSFVVTLLNGVLGTITAWVLVRDDFRGKSVVNAVIDLPFALPTIVAGLTLLALYGPTSPVGINVAFTQAVDRAGDDVRHAAVRRPDGSARAGGARPRGRAGRALARRLARCARSSA